MAITQTPSLSRLASFEKESWPEAEQASEDDLKRRLTVFPAGIFMLSYEAKDVAQVTLSPKRVQGGIKSFELMRDLPLDLNSDTLWITNMATRSDERGKGHMVHLLKRVIAWGQESGYALIQAGVTCDGYAALRCKDGISVEEYVRQGCNPALRAFERTARDLNLKVKATAPMVDYWQANKTSDGYGILVSINISIAHI